MKLIELKDQFLDILNEAQKLRPQKSKYIGNELEWIIYERNVMLNTVNTVRLQNDLLPVSIYDIKCIEKHAIGHIDYSSKFALYCAELALDKFLFPRTDNPINDPDN